MKTKREIQRLIAQDPAAALTEYERMRASLAIAEVKAKKFSILYKAVGELQLGQETDEDFFYVDRDSMNKLVDAFAKVKP